MHGELHGVRRWKGHPRNTVRQHRTVSDVGHRISSGLLSPLLVRLDPWPRAISVILLFLAVGMLAERLWEKFVWVRLYLVGGLARPVPKGRR